MEVNIHNSRLTTMKTLWIALSLLALPCLAQQTNLPPNGVAFATNSHPTITNYVKLDVLTNDVAISVAEIARRDGWMTNLVNEVCSKGDVCAVKGHQWLQGRAGETDTMIFGDYHPNTSYRHCALCGLTQTQNLQWK